MSEYANLPNETEDVTAHDAKRHKPTNDSLSLQQLVESLQAQLRQ
jgi:hypothetical protein